MSETDGFSIASTSRKKPPSSPVLGGFSRDLPLLFVIFTQSEIESDSAF